MTETVVVKLGGSVITDKSEPETVDREALEAAAAALAGTDARLVVVHGGGSFGHHHADEHGVTTERGTRDAAGALAIHEAMARLSREVVDALQSAGVPALPVRPLSAGSRNADGDLSLPTDQIRRLLGEGFAPVLHGDVVAHEGEGVTVVSGDELVAEVASAVGADRVGLCSTVPGVLDADGDVVEQVSAVGDVPALGDSDATDVTGGMAGKVRSLLALDAPAQIFGPDALSEFLAGEASGTTVDGR